MYPLISLEFVFEASTNGRKATSYWQEAVSSQRSALSFFISDSSIRLTSATWSEDAESRRLAATPDPGKAAGDTRFGWPTQQSSAGSEQVNVAFPTRSLRDVGAIDSDARKFFPGICLILPASSSSNKAAKISEDDNWVPGARRFRRCAWTHRLSVGPEFALHEERTFVWE
jgi:hypothetical protein